MDKYTEIEVVEHFERAVKNRISLELFNKMPRTSRTMFMHAEVRDDLVRYIVGLLNVNEYSNTNINNKIQHLADDINKERKKT